VLSMLDITHAKVMLMVWKQQMQHLDGYVCTKVDLAGMATKMQHVKNALQVEHGVT